MSELFQHEILDSGIHYFTCISNSSESVHSYFRQASTLIQEIVNDNPNEQVVVRFLIDFRQITLPSFADVVAETVDLQRRPSISTDRLTRRFAFLSDDEKLIDLIDSLGALTPTTYERRVFKANMANEAIDGLLES